MSKSQIIVTSRYIKSGTKRSKTKRANLTKYIATRESVEKRPQENDSVTKNQTQLINDLLTEFPKAKQFLEYEDYTAKPTAENASELISTIIERYADVIGNRKNFVGYMAMRPGAEKRGAHGLFNDKDEPINLNAVANEVANHPGNVWTHVVSLRREDAVRLGFTNSDMWRELVKRHIADIAKAQNIPLANLKWYAAFHDTSHHPHIHLIVYSTNPKQGYLTNQGIEKIRSVFANDIFHDDLKSIYQQQTLTRDELKALAEDQMKDIADEFELSDFNNPVLQNLILKLKKQLNESDGKKVYGYLKKPVKETVDEIFLELSKNEHIKDLYDKWCEFEKAKYRFYTAKEIELSPLVENNAFKPVKNMIIRTVLDMNIPEVGDGIVEESIDSEQSDIEETKIEESSEDDTLAGSTDDSSDTDDVSQEQRKKEQEALANTAMSLFLNLCSIIRNDYAQEQRRMRPKVDKKLMRVIRKKEIAMGMKYDDMDMKM
ncbi:MAG: relaxase MobL [Ruminococcus sp.]|nr:relaxase MobL [Ruminococcus sp.]